MTSFDEKSGIVACDTPWGRWWQTMEEVHVEVHVPDGTRSKDIKVDIGNKQLQVTAANTHYIQGKLGGFIHADESLWTLEDRCLIRLCLAKADQSAANTWQSLLEDEYPADPITLDKMKQKMTLERFQKEHPGMDFSGATVTGNYDKGGPTLPS